MSPEDLDLPPPNEYDRPQRRNLRQWLGWFVARRVSGASEVEMAGDIDHVDITDQVTETLSPQLEAEYQRAIVRAQSFLTALDNRKLPDYLADDESLQDAYPDELIDAVQQWAQHNAAAVTYLREDTGTCADVGASLDPRSKFDFSARVSQAEQTLRWRLHQRFGRR